MEPEVRKASVRYYEIDLLRFLAALSVVLFHFTFRGYHADSLSPVEYPLLGEVFKYGFLGVDLFFMISGYVILMSAQGKTLSQFFTSRVMRLYPAYWVACTFTFVVVRLFGPAVHAPGWSTILDAPLKGYLFSMSMLQSFFGERDLDGVYWTLSTELLFYFLIALFIAFKWLKHLPVVLAVWLAYCAYAGFTNNVSPFSFLLFPSLAPLFIAGMLFYMLQTGQAARWKLYSLLAVSYLLVMRSAGSGLVGTIQAFQHPFSLPIVGGLVTLFFALFFCVIFRWVKLRQAQWLSWAGALTYPIYLLHHNIGYVVLQRLGGKVDRHLLLLAMLAAVFGLAYLLHKFVERPFSKLLGQKVSSLLAKA
jgi:peptidoglycan/LPS O-acetylase OafA/YrhL